MAEGWKEITRPTKHYSRPACEWLHAPRAPSQRAAQVHSNNGLRTYNKTAQLSAAHMYKVQCAYKPCRQLLLCSRLAHQFHPATFERLCGRFNDPGCHLSSPSVKYKWMCWQHGQQWLRWKQQNEQSEGIHCTGVLIEVDSMCTQPLP